MLEKRTQDNGTDSHSLYTELANIFFNFSIKSNEIDYNQLKTKNASYKGNASSAIIN